MSGVRAQVDLLVDELGGEPRRAVDKVNRERDQPLGADIICGELYIFFTVRFHIPYSLVIWSLSRATNL